MKKKIGIWVLIIVVIGGIVFLRIQSKNKLKYTSVKTTTVAKGDVKSYLSTTAAIQSKNSKDYYGISAKVTEVDVKVGDNVKSGQVMVKYEATDLTSLRSAVTQAQVAYNNAVLAKQDLTNQNNDFIHINNLYHNRPNLTPDELNTYNQLRAKYNLVQPQTADLPLISDTKFKQADNSITSARAALTSANDNLSRGAGNASTITADFDGVVTTVNSAQGAMGNPGMVAVTVQDLKNLKGVISVGKYDAPKIAVGQDATIKTQGNQYKGKVSSIDPAAKQTVGASGTDSVLNAQIDINNPGADLKIGFDTDVDILLSQVNNVINVPVECIRTDKNDRNFVYIVQGDKAVEKEVKLGLQSDIAAQVLSGVSEGDKVILNPSTSIQNGSFVKESAGVGK